MNLLELLEALLASFLSSRASYNDTARPLPGAEHGFVLLHLQVALVVVIPRGHQVHCMDPLPTRPSPLLDLSSQTQETNISQSPPKTKFFLKSYRCYPSALMCTRGPGSGSLQQGLCRTWQQEPQAPSSWCLSPPRLPSPTRRWRIAVLLEQATVNRPCGNRPHLSFLKV